VGQPILAAAAFQATRPAKSRLRVGLPTPQEASSFLRGALAAVTLIAFALAQSGDRSVWDGVYTEEQDKRGEPLYRQHCASCHGVAMEGGEEAPALAGGAFLANWNGLTVGDLFERMRTTMPANKPGRLARQDNADILAHMLRVNQFPAGKSELRSQTEMLKQIKFEAAKPTKPEAQ
jgi:mono/diheme cytochrome c family protein